MSEKEIKGTIEEVFSYSARHPARLLEEYRAAGQKAVGILPYYAPEELVYAAGMAPLGLWGMEGSVRGAGRYFPAFYCAIARMNLEMALVGVLDGLSAVLAPSICDAMRPFTQNFKSARPDIPMIFLAQPQNRTEEFGVVYMTDELARVREELEAVAGTRITDDAIRDAIAVYNESRAERRRFVRLAASHPSVITPERRSDVLKSAWFMPKPRHTAVLKTLNDAIEALAPENWTGGKVVVSGILADSASLLSVFQDNRLAIVADDVANESRSFRSDMPLPEKDEAPLRILARGFAGQGADSLLHDPDLSRRARHLKGLVEESGAQGVVFVMMQFCDPEELDYPHLKQALDAVGIPNAQIGYDQQMRDFGQARTQLEAFSEMLADRGRRDCSAASSTGR
ncbi:MAG: 2-hydroxyacyl-CoA dehydratase family protein [Clostridiales Family XIII bacterium]|jgi:bcr-type benzoyl-CoA reductase subunit C|nr:2-hydroxyacyl-CoA dehydratase family protein [Clostridiales Family XIII bacterium]